MNTKRRKTGARLGADDTDNIMQNEHINGKAAIVS